MGEIRFTQPQQSGDHERVGQVGTRELLKRARRVMEYFDNTRPTVELRESLGLVDRCAEAERGVCIVLQQTGESISGAGIVGERELALARPPGELVRQRAGARLLGGQQIDGISVMALLQQGLSLINNRRSVEFRVGVFVGELSEAFFGGVPEAAVEVSAGGDEGVGFGEGGGVEGGEGKRKGGKQNGNPKEATIFARNF